MPRWLGETYARLYETTRDDVFSLADAQKLLGFNESTLRAAFSALHRRRLLLVFARRRPRMYRLLTPEHFLLLAAEAVSNVERIHQERYLKLILDVLEVSRRAHELVSFAVYGSVARGTATTTSDVDILLVSRDFREGLGKRLNELVALTRPKIDEELGRLWKHGVYATVSFLPLNPEEVERMPFLFADLTDDAVILYDQEKLLERVIARLRAKLLESGAQRVWLDQNRDQWYWDLKPSYKLGALTTA